MNGTGSALLFHKRTLLASVLNSILVLGGAAQAEATILDPMPFLPTSLTGVGEWVGDGLAIPFAPSTTLTVTSCADDGTAGTLRSVMLMAPEGALIDLGALTCSTITLTQGPIDLGDAGPHPVAYLDIAGPTASTLTIDGSGSQIFVHGRATSPGALHIRHLTIAHGASTNGSAACIASLGSVGLDHVVVDDCHSVAVENLARGGAISAMGDLVMTSSRLSGSTVVNDYGPSVGGGAFVKGNAFVTDSVVVGNAVTGGPNDGLPYRSGGGGLFVAGDLHILQTIVSDNSAVGAIASGGGIAGLRNLTIERSLVHSNSCSLVGGRIAKNTSTYDPDRLSRSLTIISSTVSGNSARLNGGVSAIYSLTIKNSTIADNSASSVSAGIYFSGAPNGLLLQNSIVTGNFSGMALDHPSDVVGNRYSSPATVVVVGDHNLVGAAEGDIVLPADTLSIDAMLAPLADNGGPTWTHGLLPGSPAIDAGNNFFGFPTDQRGFPRLAGAQVDIGAFELEQPQYDLMFSDGFEQADH